MSEELPYGLGRVYVQDNRDKNYPVSAILPAQSAGETYRYWWSSAWWGNQGKTPQCVAYAWMHWLEDGPTTHFYEGRNFDPAYLNKKANEKHQSLFEPGMIYEKAQKKDRWPGECVDTETECLTKEGWKKYDELEIGEYIATFNIETEKLEFKPLEKVHIHPNSVLNIYDNRNIKVAITENHKWPTKKRTNNKGRYDFIKTAELNHLHISPLCAHYENFPTEKKYNDSFVKLIGWVITEGHFRPEKRKGSAITISQQKYKSELRKVLRENAIENGKEDSTGLFRCEISGEISRRIRDVAPNKMVRYDFLFDLTKEQIELFVDTLELGDGSFTTQEDRLPRRTFHQLTDNGNVLEIWEMANILLGKSISRTNQRSYSFKGLHKTIESWGVKQAKNIHWRKMNKSIPFVETAWCPQTENKTFMAKRNGSVFITGNSYDGTSVRAGAKVLKELGVIEEYRWAGNVDEVAQSILSLGPMVVGTPWYKDMFYPDKNGFIKPGGDQAGGHAYVLNGVNMNKRYFRIKNSWGRGWGKNGYAYITFDDFAKLLNEWGEACIAVEKKRQ